ncbi:MAG: DUF3667 domain-containing protein [Alloprevotella sp.]|nr:DUF3667 domain-containing protein [Alloprevotella sp.]
MTAIKDKVQNLLARLVAWQRKPIDPEELRTEETLCRNCEHRYIGNFCPRCGQYSRTSRLGSDAALRVFLDTWGLGTHSLLRTLWGLIARPGYMIGDYLNGRRQPYFPPFKTLFVVGTFYALIFALGGGFSEEAVKERRQNTISFEIDLKDAAKKEAGKSSSAKERQHEERSEEQFTNDLKTINTYWQQYLDWQQRNRVTDQLLMHIVFAVIAWRLFRKSPRRPGTNLAENIIAQVYICAQMGFVATVVMLVQMPFTPYPTGTLNSGISFLLCVYDFKQLFGYGVVRTFWKTLLMHLLFLLLITFFFMLIFIAAGVHAGFAASGA